MSIESSASRFTVLLPVTRPPAFLPYAVQSVLAQSHADFELFIVSDGAPPATTAWVKSAAERDSRIRLFDFPKGARNGEAHRHTALAEATGTFVAQIADDDLWFPDFLAEMTLHLRAVDFGNLLQCLVRADGMIATIPGDLALLATRERMLKTVWNCFGPTVAGYRMSAYRQLATGWSPAPSDLPTDLHMWRKFLSNGRMRIGTRFAIQSLVFPTTLRTNLSEKTRVGELAAFAERIRDPGARRDIAAEGFRALAAAAIADIFEAASDKIMSLQNERNLLKAKLDLLETRAAGRTPLSR
jgi:hypothetical protein